MADPTDNKEHIDPLDVGELRPLKELAEEGLLAYSTLRQHALNGRMRARRLGYQWFSTKAAVELFLHERQSKHVPKKYR